MSIEALQQAVDALKAKFDVLQAQGRINNEGGEGYNPASSIHDDLVEARIALSDAKFTAEWTAEVFASRRAAWNDAVTSLKNPVVSDILYIERKLGFTQREIAAAKAIYVK